MPRNLVTKLSGDEKIYQVKRLLKSLEVQILDQLGDLFADKTYEFDLEYELSIIKNRNNETRTIVKTIFGNTGTLIVGRK